MVFIKSFIIIYICLWIFSLFIVEIFITIANLISSIKLKRKINIDEMKRMDKELRKYKKDKKEYIFYLYFLYLDLIQYCIDNEIELIYGEDEFLKKGNEDSCGLYYSERMIPKGAYNKNDVIYIKKIIYLRYENTPDDLLLFGENYNYRRDPISTLSTLAHEVGHYIAVHEVNDRSEEAADFYAKKLCIELLGPEGCENEFIEIFLKNYMHKAEYYIA